MGLPIQIQSFDDDDEEEEGYDDDAAMRASLGKIVEIMYRKDVFFPPSHLRARSLSPYLSLSLVDTPLSEQ